MNNKNANYHKLNDGSMCSSTYHKKDGTNVRAVLKQDTEAAIKEYEDEFGIGSWLNLSTRKKNKLSAVQRDHREYLALADAIMGVNS